jgi:type II secretory pathway component PulJ
MDAVDLAAILLAVVALAATAALAVVCTRLARATRELTAAVEEVQRVVPAAAHDLSDAADRAGRQVDRLEAVIHTTGAIADTVDTATQATFRVLSNPVIKGAAIASGTGRAARRLRGRPTDESREA